jgi:NAD(P)-dependent dehydrogenase (short-subunit alcohol dehydrogenase family)
MNINRPALVITGVSSGLGLAMVRAFLRRGYRVFGSLRTPADAARLQADLGDAFTPLLFDVTDASGVVQAAAEVERQLAGEPLRGLINNAGIALGGPLLYQPMSQVRQHFEVNVLGLIRVTQAFLPLLGARPNFQGQPGRVLNIGSVNGRIAAPFVGAYVGTKHALEGLTTTWRRELQLFGVPMVLIGLGVTQTPIWDKGIDLEAYRHTPYYPSAQRFVGFVNRTRAKGFQPEYVANRLVTILETPRPRLRYTIVPDLLQGWIIPRLLPARMFDWFLGWSFGLARPIK